jgi:hypothetical protein
MEEDTTLIHSFKRRKLNMSKEHNGLEYEKLLHTKVMQFHDLLLQLKETPDVNNQAKFMELTAEVSKTYLLSL